MSEEIVLSEYLNRRCKKIFSACEPFSSNEHLLSVFDVPGLQEYYGSVPQEDTREARIQQTLSRLCKWGFYNDDPVILIFLRQLFPDSRKVQLYKDLEKLYIDLSIFIYLDYPEHYRPLSSSDLAPEVEVVSDIVNNLLNCPCMLRNAHRGEVWRSLHGYTTAYHQTGIDVADIFTLIWSCPSITDIQRLVEAIHKHEGNSQAWNTLNFTVRKKTKEISYPHLRNLEEIIEEMNPPEAVWRKAYYLSVPAGWGPPLRGESLFATLEDIGLRYISSTGMQPVLEFAERLAQYAEHNAQLENVNEFRVWIDERVYALGIDPGNLIALRNKIRQEKTNTSTIFYLLVSLAPHADEKTFHMQGRLLNSDYQTVNEHFFIQIDGKPVNEEHVPSTELQKGINDVIMQCEEFLQANRRSAQQKLELRIEFFLPFSLLNCPVEQWKFDGGFVTGTDEDEIGIHYQVVLRSYDRAHNKSLPAYREWENKWQKFHDIVDKNQAPDPEARLIWICEENHHVMYSALMNYSTLCLALTFAASENSSRVPYIFNSVLDAGVPVFLWPREPAKSVMQFYGETLLWEKIIDLPLIVQYQRREAILEAAISGNANHLGRHLALFLDDPGKPLPVAAELGSFSFPE